MKFLRETICRSNLRQKFFRNAEYKRAVSTTTKFRNQEQSCESTTESQPGQIKDTAETVIIGGGIAGTCIAYHLARMGQKDVVLLERTELTAGSTWHAAGLATTFHGGINMRKLHLYSVGMYACLEAETGQGLGYHQPGSIRLATTPTRVDEMKYQMSRHNWLDAPQSLVTPEQIKELVPIADVSNVLMGIYTPYDGHVDPYSLTQAVAKATRSYGGSILQNTPVTSLKLREDGRWLVGTNKGDILANRVVNAAGFFAKEVAKLAGSDLPLVPIHHQYLVTSTVPEVKALKKEFPVLRHLEGSFYLRQERDGLLIGPYESVESMKLCEDWVRNEVPPGFGKELFNPDLDRLTPHLEVAMEIMPCFAEASIQSVVNGPITYSPDGLPMLGPDSLPNMWLAVGFGYGIVHGGGIGKFIAEWIMKGEPEFDLVECDPGRFGKWANDDYSIAKARECYGMNNAIGYPHEERFAGRPTSRVSGAYDLQIKRGARQQLHSGWEQPAWFSTTEDKPEYKPSFIRTNWHEAVGKEVDLVMTKAGIIDLTPFAKYIVEGPQAHDFLDHITANSVPKEGRAVISHLLTPSGRVYGELTITRTAPQSFLVITGSGSEIHDLRWLEDHARRGGWKVSLSNVTEEMGCLSVAGPKSKELLSKLSPRFKDKFPFFTACRVDLAGVPTTALRLSYTGELGWELYHPRNMTHQLYEALLDEGKHFGAGDFGTLALNCLRLEKGFKGWGAEMNLDTNIVEAGLMPFVRLNKGDFIGRSAVVEIMKSRQERHLLQIQLDSSSEADPLGNETVWLEGKVIGNTTSGSYSYHLGAPLAFSYLPPYVTTPGSQVQVELMGKMCTGTVLAGPPVHTHTARVAMKKKQ